MIQIAEQSEAPSFADCIERAERRNRPSAHRDNSANAGRKTVNTPTYDKSITALLVVDPYNDFISEGGKLWPRIKAVAEANNCVPHMLEVLNTARKAKLWVFFAIRVRSRHHSEW